MKKLLKLAVIVGGVAIASKMAAAKKAEWQGLTESQVREKLDSELPSEIPNDKRAKVMDKVVSVLADRGMLSEESAPDQTPESVD